MPNLTGLLAGLSGIPMGIEEAQMLRMKQQQAAQQQAFQQLAMQQVQEQQRAQDIGFQGLMSPQIQQALMPQMQPGMPGMPTQSPMPQTAAGGGLPPRQAPDGGFNPTLGPTINPQSADASPYDKAVADSGQTPTSPTSPTGIGAWPRGPLASAMGAPLPQGGQMPGGTYGPLSSGRASWFGNDPAHGFVDPGDSGNMASGLPVAGNPGIALRIPKSSPDFGKMYAVTDPSTGITRNLPQTDYGPAASTGRMVDIDAAAVPQFGYTAKTFPTDKQFQVAALNGQFGLPGASFVQMGAGVPAVRNAAMIGGNAVSSLNPQQFGMLDLPALAKAIDAAAPDESGHVKMMALGNIIKLAAPEDRMMWQMMMQQNRQAFQVGLLNEKLQAGMYGGQMTPIMQADGSFVGFNTRTGAVTPIPGLGPGSSKLPGATDPEKITPATQAFNAFMKAHPDATPEQQQQFILSGKPQRYGAGYALRQFVEEYTAEHGKAPSSQEIRDFQAQTAEQVTEARGVATRTGGVETAAQVLDSMAPLLEEASNNVDRTKYKKINDVIEAWQEGTGDENIVKYGEMMNEVRYLYGRALAGGGTTRVADLQHFDKVMNEAWSKGQVRAGIEQLQRSIGVERETLKKRREEVTHRADQPGSTASGAQPSGDISQMNSDDLAKLTAPGARDKLTPQQIEQIKKRAAELRAQVQGGQ